MTFKSEYKDLLLKQYWGKPNAGAEVELLMESWQRTFEFLASFPAAFDIDSATGDRLDIIGRMVQLERKYPFVPVLSDDEEYRFFLKAKIAKNTGSAYMVSDQYTSIQEVIELAFEGDAYVVDNQDMTLSLYVDLDFDLNRLQTIVDLGLLPKPQGVRYDKFIQSDIGDTFGFASNPNSQGFASKSDPGRDGGKLARKVLI